MMQRDSISFCLSSTLFSLIQNERRANAGNADVLAWGLSYYGNFFFFFKGEDKFIFY